MIPILKQFESFPFCLFVVISAEHCVEVFQTLIKTSSHASGCIYKHILV